MSTQLPDYYFRIRENGAIVFRIDTENRQRRIEMDQIAVLNIRNGEVKPHGGTALNDADTAAIASWMADRSATLADRDLAAITGTCEQMNLTAHWANTKASDAQLEAVTDELLLAMHDLRTVLVRKKSNRAKGDQG